MIRPPVLHIAGIAALVLLGLMILGFAIATQSLGSAAAFAVIVGGVGIWFFRSARR